jgi:uncharacterized repeat protein (TIGR04138 family)
MQPTHFQEVVERILAKDSRYTREAYLFVREGLDFAQKPVQKEKGTAEAVHHISGRELLGGLRGYALDQYGPMAITLLEEWGIRRCEDFGEIVFNMVDFGLLSKTETDSREDFKGAYDFAEAFRKPFLPGGKPKPPPIPAAPSQPGTPHL